MNQLRGLGWDDKTLQVGDKVVVVVSKSKFDDTAGRLRDMLVYGATPDEPAAVYLEFKGDGKPEWQAPYEVYKTAHAVPRHGAIRRRASTRQRDAALRAARSPHELAAAKREFGARVLLLRDAK